MKMMLSLLLTLMLLAVPALPALAEYGWEGDLFWLYDADIAFAVPEGAVAAGDEELAAMNDADPTGPQAIFMVQDPATRLSCTVALKAFDSPASIPEFLGGYIDYMAVRYRINPSAITREVSPFFGIQALFYTGPFTSSGLNMLCISYLIDVGTNVYTITLGTSFVNETVFDTFLAQLYAPMHAK